MANVHAVHTVRLWLGTPHMLIESTICIDHIIRYTFHPFYYRTYHCLHIIRDPDVIHTSGNEAYLAVKKTGESDIEDYEIPMPPSPFPSSQPAAGNTLYEPV